MDEATRRLFELNDEADARALEHRAAIAAGFSEESLVQQAAAVEQAQLDVLNHLEAHGDEIKADIESQARELGELREEIAKLAVERDDAREQAGEAQDEIKQLNQELRHRSEERDGLRADLHLEYEVNSSFDAAMNDEAPRLGAEEQPMSRRAAVEAELEARDAVIDYAAEPGQLLTDVVEAHERATKTRKSLGVTDAEFEAAWYAREQNRGMER
ncbi:hypothetical protein [Blastococcus sp. VKM Ac-2987]|uniref:hypothetical protein n=1 Tax=Blastococcus sp. VKM Ac-2987 TaxID=3004141 RepID=UPI0022ABB25D|nr:hypothetical protein [Blastococcus sp. VKM Ac-2987]MCZ2857411.1 hypothetical protein [Blastococcus sp. VKM Ac-2987]